MKIIAIIQARMGSTRLPGKSLMYIGDKPLIQHVYDRVSLSKLTNTVVLATSTSKKDDVLAEFATEKNWNLFRGPEEDLVARFFLTAKEYNPDFIIRVCADNPFMDPKIVDELIQKHLASGADYSENIVANITHYPDSVGAEIFSFKILEKTFNTLKTNEDGENIRPSILKNSSNINHIEAPIKFAYPQIKIDVDTLKDLRRVRRIYSELIKIKKDFGVIEIVNLYKQNKKLFD